MNDINLIISSLRGGGAERAAVLLCNEWAEQGLKVALITLSGGADDDYRLSAKVDRLALELESVSSGALSGAITNINRVRCLRRALKNLPALNCIGFSSTSNILLILASANMRSNIIVAERNYPLVSMRGRLWTTLRKHLYRFADHVVVQTQAGAQWLDTHTSTKHISVIPNAIRLPIPITEPVRDVASVVPPEKRLLLAVGNIHPQKGFDLLVEALKQTRINSNDWIVVIAGAGDTEDLQQRISQAGLSEHVQVVGRVGNIGDWFDRTDAFVLSSRYEGFPNVLLEAMSSGCAVVSFDCLTGPSEIIQHEENGLLVPAEDARSMAIEIDRVMQDETLRARLGSNARRVEEVFSVENHLRLWASLLNTPGAS